MKFPDKVFFITSHGMAGDPWFDWLPKAINSHSDILLFIGESVRSKYFKERSRKERPNLEQYCRFLYDVGSSAYTAVGECFGYRAYQLERLKEKNINIPWVNIIRHPYAWLEYYVNWRKYNMNMPKKFTNAIDHEWSISWHEYFKELNLMSYSKKDIEIWATYQGMTVLNRMISDKKVISRNYRLENLIKDKNYFSQMISDISNRKVIFDDKHLDLIFKETNKSWRKNFPILDGSPNIRAKWESWKNDAFEILVTNESKEFFIESGYKL